MRQLLPEVAHMSSVCRRIDQRRWDAIADIARKEGRDPRNALDLIIDAGLAARAIGNWPTMVAPPRNRGQ